jgi:hypothetical protein
VTQEQLETQEQQGLLASTDLPELLVPLVQVDQPEHRVELVQLATLAHRDHLV